MQPRQYDGSLVSSGDDCQKSGSSASCDEESQRLNVNSLVAFNYPARAKTAPKSSWFIPGRNNRLKGSPHGLAPVEPSGKKCLERIQRKLSETPKAPCSLKSDLQAGFAFGLFQSIRPFRTAVLVNTNQFCSGWLRKVVTSRSRLQSIDRKSVV